LKSLCMLSLCISELHSKQLFSSVSQFISFLKLCLLFLFCSVVFEIRSHTAQAGLKLFNFCFLSSGITGMHHCAWLVFNVFYFLDWGVPQW
jgi:di/tricarboxylate transporter